MSIKRVSELPSIEKDTQDWNEEKLSGSYMELSYYNPSKDSLGDDTKKYNSKKIKFSDIIDTIQKFYNTNVNVSGNFYVNKDDPYASYETVINTINGITFNSGAGTTKFIGNAKINMLSVENKPVNDQDAVNLKYLNEKLQELSSYINSKIGSIKSFAPPFLSFVLMDRLMTESELSDGWSIGGSGVDLLYYPELCAYVNEHSDIIKWKEDATLSNDTWYYEKVENGENIISVKLPSSNNFIQFTTNTLSSGSYVEQTLPNLSGEIYKDPVDQEPFSFIDAFNGWTKDKGFSEDGLKRMGVFQGTNRVSNGKYYGAKQSGGAGITRFNFNANASNPIYQDGANVQPRSNLFIPYFYTGKKVTE